MSHLSPVIGRLAAVIAVCVAAALPARAELAAPVGETILTVRGAIAQTNTDGAATFDMDMLRAMPSAEFATSTNWTDGVKTFTGVPLKVLLDSLGATGSKVSATALNNYSVDIPMDVIKDGVPIIAYAIDGETFPRRDKGPLWIVFPRDDLPAFHAEANNYKWIWQLKTISVR